MEEISQMEIDNNESRMEEVSISEIDNTATKLDDNDLVFISQYNQQSNSFTSAKIKGKDLLSNEKKPGMLVRMWEITEDDPSYYTALNSINSCDSKLLDQITPETDTIPSILTLTNGTDTKTWDAASIYDLNVTAGVGALHDTDNGGYFDWYNGLKWKYYTAADSNNSSVHIIAYFTRVYLNQGQTIAFKGIPANTLTILIDGGHPVDTSGIQLNYVTSDSEHYQNATYISNSAIFRYLSNRTGYHTIKIIATNRGGDDNKFDAESNLMMSLNNGKDWFEMTNDALTTPIFFIPEGDTYNDIWYQAERIREQDDHFIDFEDNGGVDYQFDSATQTVTLTANDSGTLMIALGGQLGTSDYGGQVVVKAKMPDTYTSNPKWVEVTRYVAHHGGGWQSTFYNIAISLPLRVIKGTMFTINPLKSIDYQNCTLFKDTAFKGDFKEYSDNAENIENYTVTFMSNNSIYQQKNVRSGITVFDIRPTIDPTRNSDSSFDYQFKNWDISDDTVITSNMTINAVYDYILKSYSVKFINNDGTILQSGEVKKWSTPEYTGNDPVYANPKGDATYTFTGWNPPISSISSDTVYVAQYNIESQTSIDPDPEIQYYRVRFIVNNVVISEQLVKHDSSTTIADIKPENPQDINTESGLNKFRCWNYTDTYVISGDTDVNALFDTIKNYTVTWIDSITGETIITNTNVQEQTKISEIKPKYNQDHVDERFEYQFDGWDVADDVKVISNLTVYTKYIQTDRIYTIRFMNGTTPIQTSKSRYGESITLPDNPTYNGQLEEGSIAAFVSWSPAPSTIVTKDAEYTAVYNITNPKIKIRFFDHRMVERIDENAAAIMRVDKGSDIVDLQSPNDCNNALIGDGWELKGWYGGDDYKILIGSQPESKTITRNIDFYGWYSYTLKKDKTQQLSMSNKTISYSFDNNNIFNSFHASSSMSDITGLNLSIANISFDWTLTTSTAHNHTSTITVDGQNDDMNRTRIISYTFGYNNTPQKENIQYISDDRSLNDGNGLVIDSSFNDVIFTFTVNPCAYVWQLSNIIVTLHLT